MKLTNTLLIILIAVILLQNLEKKTVLKNNTTKKHNAILIKPMKTTKYKSIIPVIKEKKKATKHSTTFRTYINSDNRLIMSINHNIRIGKNYYISGGIISSQSSYGKQEIGTNISLTKYW